MARRHPWWADRTTGDLLILGIASTVCIAVLSAGAALFLLTLLRPEQDTSQGFHAVSDVVNTLIGVLAGFLAGRTDVRVARQRRAAEAVQDVESDAG